LNGEDNCNPCVVEGGVFASRNVVNEVLATGYSGTPNITQSAMTSQQSSTTLNFGSASVSGVSASATNVMNNIDLAVSP
jgi:hypothetical protein